jgi:hypothetical protein
LAHFLDRQGRLKDNCKIPDLSSAGITFTSEEIDRVEQEFKLLEDRNIKLDFAIPERKSQKLEDEFDLKLQLDDALSSMIDSEQCTIEGRGADTAFASEENVFTIIARNKKGEPLTTGGDRFDVNLVMDSDPTQVVKGRVRDLGNGRYEVRYIPSRVGKYHWNILLDGKHQLTHKTTKIPVRVVPGDVCIQNSVIIDPQHLQPNQREGDTFVFHIQARDKCGNNCTRGGFKFHRSQLVYLGNNVKNKPIDCSSHVGITDLSNGQYRVSVKNCLPGMFQLYLGDEEGNLVPQLNPFSLGVSPAPVPKLLVKFEQYKPGSGVAQFRVTAFDGNSKPPYIDDLNDPRIRDNTKWVSVVCNEPIGTNLSNEEMANMEETFRTQFVNWINDARKEIFNRLINPKQEDREEDEVTDTVHSSIWAGLNSISNESKCIQLKDNLNKNNVFPKKNTPVDYVTISDDYMDWSKYDNMLKKEQDEANRREMELKIQEENERKRREDEERRRQEEYRKSLLRTQPPVVVPVTDPNQYTVKPRLCAINFWVVLSNLMTDAVSSQANMKNIEPSGLIKGFETQELRIRVMTRPDVYYTAKKKDVKLYGDLTLNIAQRYIFEMLEEFQQTLGSSYHFLEPFINQECKKCFAEFERIHRVFGQLIESTDPHIAIGGEDMFSDVDKSMRKKAKNLIMGFKRVLLQAILMTNQKLSQEMKRRDPRGMDDDSVTSIVKRSLFFKTTLNDVFNGFLRATAYTMSSQPRKIMAQELSFLRPVDLSRNDINSPMVATKSYAVQIPINSLFDSCLYNTRSGRSTKDRFRQGLVNPYKVVYIKDNRVIAESIRSGSLTAIGIEDKQERQIVTRINAAELLRVLAANHAKRFTRKELELLNERNESLHIPFTSVSLLTPFFLNDREDRQLMEHQMALLAMLEEEKVNSVVIDLYDNQPPIHINVCFPDPCLINIGTNVVIKTFMCGLGIQRAINGREFGMRRFEQKVQKFLTSLGSHKQSIRKDLHLYLNQIFSSSREGSMYKDTLVKRLEQVETAFYCLCRDENLTKQKRNYLEFELKNKQAELEKRMRQDWLPNFDQATSVEITYQTKIKYLVNEIHTIMRNLYKIESKFESRYAEIIELEQLFIKELHSTVVTLQQTVKNFPLPPRWAEFCEFVQKEKDIWDLFSDLRYLYHEGMHEKFSQGLVESSHVKGVDPYAVPVRVNLLSFLIGEQSHFNCKSGKDRTGELTDQICEFAELREQFNEYPKQRVEKKLFNHHRQHIHTNIAMNGGSLEIIKQNLGLPGSKADASVSGRFKDGFYQKYKGLSNIDNTSYASNLEFWQNHFHCSPNGI